jgi:hypothetical protein
MKLKECIPSLLSSSVSLAADMGDVRGDFMGPRLPSLVGRLFWSDDERGSDSDWSSSTADNITFVRLGFFCSSDY